MLCVLGLLVVAPCCGAKGQTEGDEAGVEATDEDAEDKPQAIAPSAKGKGRSALNDRPPGLIYRQAQEQARQRLTAVNAHLRLDELDAQIEHEKEIRP